MEPLYSKLRPTSLTDFIGQDHLVGETGPIRKMIETGKVASMIFWGPPASGKTTLAKVIAASVDANFEQLSAVTDGKKDLMKIIERARTLKITGQAELGDANFTQEAKQTILFIDEIHRWSKAQQDALLPFLEDGTVVLIGATTENPSFTVISPLLSRSRVFVFNSHAPEDIEVALKNALKTLKKKLAPDLVTYLAQLSNGDMRFALNSLDIVLNLAGDRKIVKEDIESAAQRFLRHDKGGEEHFNIISAIHKSLRAGNGNAAVYWVARMLEAGDDPLYIARRLLRFASEDIGNANPNALLLANQVYDTCQKLGVPECDTALAQLADYLANSPKSRSAADAIAAAREDARRYGNLPVPMHLRNAPTDLMKELGYGKRTQESDFPEGMKDQVYFK